MYSNRVSLIQNGIFVLEGQMNLRMSEARHIGRNTYLSSSIDDVAFILDIVIFDCLCECRLDSRKIRILEMAFNELDDQRRLPYNRTQRTLFT